MTVTSFAFGARKRSVTDLSALISGETTGGPPRPPPRLAVPRVPAPRALAAEAVSVR